MIPEPRRDIPKRIFRAACERAEGRESDPEWVENELLGFHADMAAEAQRLGVRVPTLEEARRVERVACGHCDYMHKLAYGAEDWLLLLRRVGGEEGE